MTTGRINQVAAAVGGAYHGGQNSEIEREAEDIGRGTARWP